MSPQKENITDFKKSLGLTLVTANRIRRTKVYQSIPIAEREELLRNFGYSPDAARQIAWVSRYLSAFNFNGEFFQFEGKK